MTFRLRTTETGVTTSTFPHLRAAHGIVGRTGGVSDGSYASLNLGPRSGDQLERVSTNRERALVALGLAGRRLLAPRQVHGAEVAVHRRGDALPPRHVFDGDGLITDDPDTALLLLTADCAAILLHDPRWGVAGILHAGWRGTAGAIASVGIAHMRAAFGCRSADIVAGIGPAIGVCCYEVGIDVAEAVARVTPAPPPFKRRNADKAFLDITTANVAQLIGAGLDPAKIVTAGICTACRTDLYFSHRREGEPTGRFGAMISPAVMLGPCA
jgi:YfiH family protein